MTMMSDDDGFGKGVVSCNSDVPPAAIMVPGFPISNPATLLGAAQAGASLAGWVIGR